MKRFLVFCHNKYYPCGGWRDFKGSFETKEEIFKMCSKSDSVFDDRNAVQFQGETFQTLMIVDSEKGGKADFVEYIWEDIEAMINV